MQQLVAITLCFLVAFSAAAPKEIRPTDSNWISVVTGLQAGDVLTVHEGTYTTSGYFGATWVGTEANPIVMQGASGEARPVFHQTSGQNIMNINGEYFLVKGIDFTGGSRGVRLGDSRDTSHAVFDSISIRDLTDNAFNANDAGRVYENITLRYSEFSGTGGTGECVYFGCQDNKCRTFNSIVEFNYCHDTTTDGSGSAGSGFQIKTGSYNNIVRHNVCKNIPGVCVLLYDDYDMGVNLIEGNVAIGVESDNGIQVTAGAIVRNNVVIGWGPRNAGIAVADNQAKTEPRNVVVMHNTIINTMDSSECLRLTNVASGAGWVVSNNVMHCPGNTAIVNAGGDFTNVPVTNNAYVGSVPTLDTSNFELPSSANEVFADISANNAYPAVGSALIGAGDATHSTAVDFNGLTRGNPPTVGAYEFSTNTNPGWTVQGQFKQLADGAAPLSNNIGPSASNNPTNSPSTSFAQTNVVVSFAVLASSVVFLLF
jgi:hypothetical protein